MGNERSTSDNKSAATMSLIDLLRQVRDRNIELWVAGAQLRYRAAPGALNDTLLEALQAKRSELIAFLSRPVLPVLQPASTEIDEAPLSYPQEQLWLLERTSAGTSAYHVSIMLWLTGALDCDRLTAALNAMVQRHDILRTVFRDRNGILEQKVAAAAAIALQVTTVAKQAECQRLAREIALAPFDFAAGPLLRATLIRYGEATAALVLATHHICVDGWSLAVLTRDILAYYSAPGQCTDVPRLTMRYADFAAWQREPATQAAFIATIDRSFQFLHGAPPVLPLSTDRPRPRQRSFRGRLVPVRIEAGLTNRLKALALQQRASLFNVIFAAFAALMHRMTDEDDLVIGTVAANRRWPGTEDVVGFFANLLPVRISAGPELSFATLLAQLQAVLAGVQEAEYVPFELLAERFAPRRDPSINPLVQVVFAFQNVPLAPVVLPGLAVELTDVDLGVAKFDLLMSLRPNGDELVGFVEFATDLFDQATIERLVAWYLNLLHSVAMSANQKLIDLELTDSGGRGARSVIESPALVAAAEMTAHGLFARQARLTPELPAVDDGHRVLSYRELDRRSAALACGLRRSGIGPDTLVAVDVPRKVDLLVALLGVLRAGGAYLALDPGNPPERRRAIVETANPRLIVTVDERASEGPQQPPLITLSTLEAMADGIAYTEAACDLNRLAYAIFTSGSTGKPKGIGISHRSVGALLGWAIATYSRQELNAVLAATSVGFDISVFELFAPLAVGGTAHLAPDLLTTARGGRLDRISLINTVPSLMQELLRFGPLPDTVRTVNLAGEALPLPLAHQILAQNPLVRLVNLYGPSETTVYATAATITADTATISIGRPIAGTRISIRDRRLQITPTGIAGEIAVAGFGVGRGYLGAPGTTAARFVPEPEGHAGSRMYMTGDRGRVLADGSIAFLGRLDRQIKIDGVRIEPGELEAVLLKHPKVAAAWAGMFGDIDLVNERNRLGAFVVASEDAAETLVEEIRTLLHQHLPLYMHPATIRRVAFLPKLPSGKVDVRRLVAEMRPATPPALERRSPQTAIESVLCDIWQDVLGAEHVGPQDDFFALGGRSLSATRIAAKIEPRLGIAISARELFEHSVLADFAARLELAQPHATAVRNILAAMAAVEKLSDEEIEMRLRALASDTRDEP